MIWFIFHKALLHIKRVNSVHLVASILKLRVDKVLIKEAVHLVVSIPTLNYGLVFFPLCGASTLGVSGVVTGPYNLVDVYTEAGVRIRTDTVLYPPFIKWVYA